MTPAAHQPCPCLDSTGESVRSPRPWGFWATIGLSFAIGAAEVGIQLVIGLVLFFGATAWHRSDFIEALESGANGFYWALATLGAAPVTIGLTGLFAWLRRGITVRDYLALNPVTARLVLRWCVYLLVFAVLCDAATYGLNRPVVPEVMIEAYKTACFPPLLWLALIAGAPLTEELFFRGFLFKGILHSRLGGSGAILITSVVWAGVHLQYDWYGMLTILVAGLLLGCARLKTRSIYPGLVMHALMNFLASLQVLVLLKWVDPGT